MEVSEFEQRHVVDVYEEISRHFDKTRYHTWPIIQKFTDEFEPNSYVADVGCGNGRNSILRNDVDYTGFEIVKNFVNICKQKNIDTVHSNILDLQCSNDIFDYTMCIAVIHHLDSETKRIRAIDELVRITKLGGKILIYVWAKEQKKFQQRDTQDVMVPWKLNHVYSSKYKEDTCYERYYHLFKNGELESLISKTTNKINIIERGYQKDNYYVVLKKEH